MAEYRIETLADPASGLFYVEVFYPSDATTPVAKTKAIYASQEEAVRRIEETIKTAFPDPAATEPVWNVLLIDNA